MSTPTQKEKKRIPSLFGVFEKKGARNVGGYLYVSFEEVLPKRAKTDVFIPDLKGDWYDSVQGWPVHAKVVDEGDDFIEIIGDKWQIFTDVRLVGGNEIVHRTTKTLLGVYEEDYSPVGFTPNDECGNKESVKKAKAEAIRIAMHSLGWGFPDGFVPEEFRIAKKFNSRPIKL